MGAKVIGVSDQRQMYIHSSLGDEMFVPCGLCSAAAHWRNVAEIEQVSVGRTPGSPDGEPIAFTRGLRPRKTGDILDAIVAEGCWRTRWHLGTAL